MGECYLVGEEEVNIDQVGGLIIRKWTLNSMNWRRESRWK